MKSILTKSLLCILMAFPAFAFAQRAGNQRLFKATSRSKYEKSRIKLKSDPSSGLYQTNDYEQTTSGGIRTYMKENEMIFEVRTLMNAKADRFLAVFNVTQVGETAELTNKLINKRIETFVNKVWQLDIYEEDVYVDMIYLIPTYEYEVDKKLFSKTYNEVPSGFEMQKNVHIAFSDIDKVEEIVTLAAGSEIYDLVKLDFYVANTADINDTLREVSIARVNKALKSYEKLGFDLKDEFKTAREATKAVYPESRYEDFAAFVSQSLEAAKKKSVTTLRKPKTVAYDQIPYEDFSVVINPNLLEPVVQFMYTLQVKYTLEKPEKPKEKNNYMLVTPTGEIIPLKIQSETPASQ